MMSLEQALIVFDKHELGYIYVGDYLRPAAMLRAENIKTLGLNGIIENLSAGVDDKGVPYIPVPLNKNTYC